jgi:uncharacterized protein (UPF0335 family)
MTAPSVEVVANDVGHLIDRVEKLEAEVKGVMKMQYWLMGASVVFGGFMTLLMPKIAEVLGLS